MHLGRNLDRTVQRRNRESEKVNQKISFTSFESENLESENLFFLIFCLLSSQIVCPCLSANLPCFFSTVSPGAEGRR
jgi:hypothetical protein